ESGLGRLLKGLTGGHPFLAFADGWGGRSISRHVSEGRMGAHDEDRDSVPISGDREDHLACIPGLRIVDSSASPAVVDALADMLRLLVAVGARDDLWELISGHGAYSFLVGRALPGTAGSTLPAM